jgi:hypothetical protein
MSQLRRKNMDGKIHIPDPVFPALTLCARRREFVRVGYLNAYPDLCVMCKRRLASRMKQWVEVSP